MSRELCIFLTTYLYQEKILEQAALMDVHILITETQKIRVRFLGQEDPLEEEIATGSSILA